MSRDIYLENTPLPEALSKWLGKLESEGRDRLLSDETIKVIDSLGRITAEAVIAKISSPFYHSSGMDGYAVKFADTFGSTEKNPKRLKIGEQAVYVDTGDPIPDGFNAVIMIEDVNIVRSQQSNPPLPPFSKGGRGGINEYIEIISPATPWEHVRVIGEDIVETELIMPENHRIRPVDIGAMLAGGHTEVNVRKKPRVVIIPTGDEIVEPGTELKKGDIIEYNSRILSGLVIEWGGEPVRFRIVPDKPEELKKAILKAH
ncbi:MAG: molybdopterin biosynthesis protein, partial [Nitrospira sp.]|nr:molybdopterin biosynthesis protein [Nitrospira sp.]